jgi:hypothetical protein
MSHSLKAGDDDDDDDDDNVHEFSLPRGNLSAHSYVRASFTL